MIVGPSGCGKATLVRHWVRALHAQACDKTSNVPCGSPPICPLTAAHSAALKWDPGLAVISQFRSIEGSAGEPAGGTWLSSVGLSSIPCWCMPHHALSTGQAYRADLARQLEWASHPPETMADRPKTLPLLVLERFGCASNVLIDSIACRLSIARRLVLALAEDHRCSVGAQMLPGQTDGGELCGQPQPSTSSTQTPGVCDNT